MNNGIFREEVVKKATEPDKNTDYLKMPTIGTLMVILTIVCSIITISLVFIL